MEATKPPIEKSPQVITPTESTSARTNMTLLPLEKTVTTVAIIVIVFFLAAVVVIVREPEH